MALEDDDGARRVGARARGWFPDPSDELVLRYWDGSRWAHRAHLKRWVVDFCRLPPVAAWPSFEALEAWRASLEAAVDGESRSRQSERCLVLEMLGARQFKLLQLLVREATQHRQTLEEGHRFVELGQRWSTEFQGWQDSLNGTLVELSATDGSDDRSTAVEDAVERCRQIDRELVIRDPRYQSVASSMAELEPELLQPPPEPERLALPSGSPRGKSFDDWCRQAFDRHQTAVAAERAADPKAFITPLPGWPPDPAAPSSRAGSSAEQIGALAKRDLAWLNRRFWRKRLADLPNAMRAGESAFVLIGGTSARNDRSLVVLTDQRLLAFDQRGLCDEAELATLETRDYDSGPIPESVRVCRPDGSSFVIRQIGSLGCLHELCSHIAQWSLRYRPAGWYPDPQSVGGHGAAPSQRILRYWDGAHWSEATTQRSDPRLGTFLSYPPAGVRPSLHLLEGWRLYLQAKMETSRDADHLADELTFANVVVTMAVLVEAADHSPDGDDPAWLAALKPWLAALAHSATQRYVATAGAMRSRSDLQQIHFASGDTLREIAASGATLDPLFASAAETASDRLVAEATAHGV
jgi:Protein of unknown function (DUF2510)